MRKNLPVTDREYVLKDHETVVSKTDLHGNITYVNADFVKISGFSEEELIGSPQNIVRHPDMPPAAFADFWNTISSGKAWTGMVKNRCKNGDYYWVEANAAPMLVDGKMVGFTSIRVKPDRSRVEAADRAYRALAQGDTSIAVREGSIVRRSFWRRFDILSRLSMTAKIAFASVFLSALFGIDLAVGIMTHAKGANLTSAVSLTGIALSLLAGILLHRELIRPLEQARLDIEKMGAGDLTGRIEARGDDEVGALMQALRILQINIKLLVGQIKEGTDVVASGIAEIAAGNADVSARTEAQASSLEETASSMEELTSTVKQNADNAREANGLVLTASTTATQGGHDVGKVVATMSSIRDSSRRIVDIISVIDGIAFQTNILALNAAVEAARAGEQGRGFAVVASEVRNLAQRSAAAAKEIKELIGDSVDKVEVGGALVEAAGKTMAMVVESVQQVAGYMNDITVASREQSEGIEQVNQAITQMDDITQQNAAMVEEAAAAADRMRDQANKLSMLVNAFTLVNVTGRRAGQGTAPATAQPPRRPARKAAPLAVSAPAPARRQASRAAVAEALEG